MLVDLGQMVVRVQDDLDAVHMQCLGNSAAGFSCKQAEQLRAAFAKAIKTAKKFKAEVDRVERAEKKARKSNG